MKEITKDYFIEATGYEPENDDLDRVNCEDAGKIGHECCGWNTCCDRPKFSGCICRERES
jgi:hypothetical protein